jgi:hypothetical protein
VALKAAKRGRPRAARGAGEDDRAAAEWRQPTHRLAAEQAGEAANPQDLEMLRRHLADIDGSVVAHVEHSQVGGDPSASLHRLVEQGDPQLPDAVDDNRRRCVAGGAESATLPILAAVRPATSVIALFRKRRLAAAPSPRSAPIPSTTAFFFAISSPPK